MFSQLAIAAVLVAITTLIIKKTWWDKLDTWEEETTSVKKKSLVTK